MCPGCPHDYNVILFLLGAMLIDRQQFSSLDENLPIFLSTLDCGNNDDAIIDCDRNDRLGLTNCRHDQDVYIHCEGKLINACP